MSTKRPALGDEELLHFVQARISEGCTMTAIAKDLGLSRQRLEAKLNRCGWKVGRKLVQINPLPQPQEATR